jgi:DNA-binding CsgD family transcriptional regulator
MKDQLTKREKEILALIAEERTSTDISAVLGISIRTVETHRKNLTRKTGSVSPAGLVKYAIRAGLVTNYYFRSAPAGKDFQNPVMRKIIQENIR